MDLGQEGRRDFFEGLPEKLKRIVHDKSLRVVALGDNQSGTTEEDPSLDISKI